MVPVFVFLGYENMAELFATVAIMTIIPAIVIMLIK